MNNNQAQSWTKNQEHGPYMRYKVVAVDIDRGQDQTGHEDNQAKCQAAQAVEWRLSGPQWKN